VSARRSPWPQSGWGRYSLGGFFALMGLIAGGSGLYQIIDEAQFAEREDMAWARIDDVRTVRQNRSTAYVADVRFVTREGQTIETSVRRPNSWMRHEPGDTALIRYDPQDPARTRIEPLSVRLIGAAIALPAGIAFGAVGWFIATGRTRSIVRGLVAAGVGLVLLLCLLLIANEVEDTIELHRDTLLAEGEVIGHRQMSRGRYGALHAPLIRFTTADGQQVVAEPPAWSTLPEPVRGTSIALRYNPDRPEEAALDRPMTRWLRLAAAGALPVVLGGAAWLLLRRFRQRAQPPRARRA
jgi:hypothetical protein